ncbi:S8 family peptidase [Pseudalkalibacillus sp. SCS-8]|uniref:S8 family peptidase n=1 Tax=Pseudalkalibacillus nanhaiensis TaxID=3115291 RepID=UPI0032DBC2FB
MKNNNWALSIGLLVLIAGVILFLPADKVEAPLVNEDQSAKRILPEKLGTKQSNHLVKKDSIQYGKDLVQKLDTSPSIGVIKHNRTKVSSHFRDREVTVRFKVKPTKEELTRLSAEINGNVSKELDATYIFQSKSQSTQEMVTYFSSKNNVLFAEPNYIYLQNETDDELYQQYQWNLPAIRTEEGWEITRGNEDVLIAIIDTGIDLKHPDLSKRLVDGYNVLNDSPLPIDDNGHGTHVAGIIASETNNGVGTAGMTWYNRIMPIKAMNADGYGTSFDVAQGIRWAVENGADVINMSLGNYKASKALKEAIDFAYDKNVIMVAASGNENTDQTSYPAAFDNVIGVAAVDLRLNRADFSNYGDYIDVAAPGVDIASTYIKGQYASLSGTSMATPHVAALAGLLRSYKPELSNAEIIKIIEDTTDDVGQPGRDQYTGNGVINVKAALEAVNRKKQPLGKFGEWFQSIR